MVDAEPLSVGLAAAAVVAPAGPPNWTNADGSHPDPWFGHGEAFDPPQPNYMVLSDNVEDPSIDPKTLAVVL